MTKSKGVFKKRVFKGNRHSRPSTLIVSEDQIEEATRPTVPTSTPTQVSSSRLKLSSADKTFDDFQDKSSNIIVSFDILNLMFSEVLCKCGGSVTLSEDVLSRNGLVNRLIIGCDKCSTEHFFWTSKKCKPRPTTVSTKQNVFETNARFFYGLRCIGKGQEAGKMLCAMLNLPPPNTARATQTNILSACLEVVAEESMTKAAKEAIEHNDGDSDIGVAYDGTWQKRGFKSKNGVATVTSIDTGKVIDVEALTKYCSGCTKARTDEQKQKHLTECVKNYEGASGGMESQAAVTIFHRSELKRQVRYVKMLGDGDSKAYLCVKDSAPYDIEVEKLECVGHVEKRLGTRLRKVKGKLGSKKLADGKPIKGQGRLTDKVIDELQSYYGKAIRSNSGSLEDMHRAVWATYFHRLSSDEKPHHQLCPPAPDTWCKYRKDPTTYKHKKSIPEAIMLEIKPVYRDLSKKDLLKKCLHGRTQNANESFNNIVWSRLPKNNFIGKKTLVLGVYDAVISFNEGNIGRLRVLEELGIEDLGKHTIAALHLFDATRIKQADRAAEEMTKEARIRKRRKNLTEEEKNEDAYCPGGF